jgi:hypothetical protein
MAWHSAKPFLFVTAITAIDNYSPFRLLVISVPQDNINIADRSGSHNPGQRLDPAFPDTFGQLTPQYYAAGVNIHDEIAINVG